MNLSGQLPSLEDIYDLDEEELAALLPRAQALRFALQGEQLDQLQRYCSLIQLELNERITIIQFSEQLCSYDQNPYAQQFKLFNQEFQRLAASQIVKEKPVLGRAVNKLPPLPSKSDSESVRSESDEVQSVSSCKKSTIVGLIKQNQVFGNFNKSRNKKDLAKYIQESLAKTKVTGPRVITTTLSEELQQKKKLEKEQAEKDRRERQVEHQRLRQRKAAQLKALKSKNSRNQREAVRQDSSEQAKTKSKTFMQDVERQQKRLQKAQQKLIRKASKAHSKKEETCRLKQPQDSVTLKPHVKQEGVVQKGGQWQESGVQCLQRGEAGERVIDRAAQEKCQKSKQKVQSSQMAQMAQMAQKAQQQQFQKAKMEKQVALKLNNSNTQKLVQKPTSKTFDPFLQNQQLVNIYEIAQPKTQLSTTQSQAHPQDCAQVDQPSRRADEPSTAECRLPERERDQFFLKQTILDQIQALPPLRKNHPSLAHNLIQFQISVAPSLGDGHQFYQQTQQNSPQQGLSQEQRPLVSPAMRVQTGADSLLQREKQQASNQMLDSLKKMKDTHLQDKQSTWNQAISKVRRQINSYKTQIQSEQKIIDLIRSQETQLQTVPPPPPAQQLQQTNLRKLLPVVKQESIQKVKKKGLPPPLPPPKKIYPKVDYSAHFHSFDSILSAFYLKGPAYSTDREIVFKDILTIFNQHNSYFQTSPYLPKPMPTFQLKSTVYYSDPSTLLAVAQQTHVPIQGLMKKQQIFGENVFGTRLDIPDSQRYYRVVKTKQQVYDIISTSFLRTLGWTELPKGCSLKTSWNLLWTWSKPEIDFNKLVIFQKVNHFPYNKNLVRKDLLYKNIDHFKRTIRGLNLNILPVTFALPKEFSQFSAKFHEDEFTEGSDRNIWIVKPIGKSRGRGIKLINSIAELNYTQNIVVQKYIKNPLLIEGFKFDMRIYVLLTSVKPIEAFIYREGFARMSTQKFSLSMRDMRNNFIHLTNFAINKHNVSNSNPIGGCKLSLKQLREKMLAMGVSWELIWQRTKDVILKSLFCCSHQIPKLPNSFELFGYDVIVDQELNCTLLQVNSSPSLQRTFILDEIVKQSLIDDIFQLLDCPQFDRTELAAVLNQRLRQPKRKEEDSVDIGRILQFKQLRQVGELPTRLGLFERIAPESRSMEIQQFFLASAGDKTVFKNID